MYCSNISICEFLYLISVLTIRTKKYVFLYMPINKRSLFHILQSSAQQLPILLQPIKRNIHNNQNI